MPNAGDAAEALEAATALWHAVTDLQVE